MQSRQIQRQGARVRLSDYQWGRLEVKALGVCVGVGVRESENVLKLSPVLIREGYEMHANTGEQSSQTISKSL